MVAINPFNYEQVAIIFIFLSILIGVLFFVRKNKFILKTKLQNEKSISVIEDVAINQTERLRLVKVGDETCNITVKSSNLKNISLESKNSPALIDEYPILSIAASCSEGRMIMKGLGELRFKESDRLAVMATGLSELGIKLKQHPDGMEIEGGTFTGGSVDAKGDHRCAMSFIIASLRASGSIRVANTEQISTSFPNFLDLANTLGLIVR